MDAKKSGEKQLPKAAEILPVAKLVSLSDDVSPTSDKQTRPLAVASIQAGISAQAASGNFAEHAERAI